MLVNLRHFSACQVLMLAQPAPTRQRSQDLRGPASPVKKQKACSNAAFNWLQKHVTAFGANINRQALATR